MTGIVFDIKEFAVNDGPGIRTTVFLKGCPLRCRWCHNPEGLSPHPEPIVTSAGRRVAGKQYGAVELAAFLRKDADVFAGAGGGVTFSGGEPLMQAEFLCEVMDHLAGIHVLIDTSGYAAADDFQKVMVRAQQVYYDLKLMDPDQHQRWTGQDNSVILDNLRILDKMDVPYTIRIPLIPSVTDTQDNLRRMAEFAAGLGHVQEIHLLPYNPLAGGKYASVDKQYRPGFDPDSGAQENPLEWFTGIKTSVRILKHS